MNVSTCFRVFLESVLVCYTSFIVNNRHGLVFCYRYFSFICDAMCEYLMDMHSKADEYSQLGPPHYRLVVHGLFCSPSPCLLVFL